VKNPKSLAGPHIEPANVTLYIFPAFRIASGEVCRADNNYILGDRGRRMQAHIGGHQVEILIIFLLEIDYPVLAEARNRHASLGV
jgi:hypothetical protein